MMSIQEVEFYTFRNYLGSIMLFSSVLVNFKYYLFHYNYQAIIIEKKYWKKLKKYIQKFNTIRNINNNQYYYNK